MSIKRREPTVTTSLGAFLERTAKRLRLPRGTRLGVVIAGRQIRSDKVFTRSRLPKVLVLLPSTPLKKAAEDLVLPRLPASMRTGAKVVAYPPGERKPADPHVRLSTAREWGDGLTVKEGEIFDADVEEALGILRPAYEALVEEDDDEAVFVAAIGRLIADPQRLVALVERHASRQ